MKINTLTECAEVGGLQNTIYGEISLRNVSHYET